MAEQQPVDLAVAPPRVFGQVTVAGRVVDVVYDEARELYRAGETRTHLVDILPMIFNHRLVLTPKGQLTTYDAGWCYPSLDAVLDALRSWDPAGGGQPPGYLKSLLGQDVPATRELR